MNQAIRQLVSVLPTNLAPETETKVSSVCVLGSVQNWLYVRPGQLKHVPGGGDPLYFKLSSLKDFQNTP